MSDFKNEKVKRSDTVFTTGAYLAPIKLPSDNWGWVVIGFEESSFKDGSEFNPQVFAESLEELLKED